MAGVRRSAAPPRARMAGHLAMVGAARSSPRLATPVARGRKTALWSVALVWSWLACACAQVRTSSVVTVRPATGEPRVFGPPEGDVSDRSYELWWLQRGPEVIVEVREHRRCRALQHVPVIREEAITRRLDGTIYWEFGVLAVTAGIGSYALARPGVFGGTLIDPAGQRVPNEGAGYRIGGVFVGIAAITLTAIVIDLFRARDSLQQVDAYRLEPGPYTPCAEPSLPLADHGVHLRLGDTEVFGRTDAEGRARLRLPAEVAFLGPSRPAPGQKPSRRAGDRRPASLVIDAHHAVRMELRYPYPPAPIAHTGHSEGVPFEAPPRLRFEGAETPPPEPAP